MECNGLEWNGLECNGLEWNGIEWKLIKRYHTIFFYDTILIFH